MSNRRFHSKPPATGADERYGNAGQALESRIALIGVDMMVSRKARCALAFFLVVSGRLPGQVPEGTILPARLSSAIDTRNSRMGDRISARVMQDVPLSGSPTLGSGQSAPGERTRKIPAGAQLIGEVVAVKPGSVSWKFDRLVVHGKSIPIRTNLRALASMMEIHDAQLPTNAAGGDRGSSELDWNTVQVGGDVVYGRRGGVVVRGGEVVGHSVFGDGVLANPVAVSGSPCRGSLGVEAPQALWLFSASACGLYGYPDVWIAHAGRSAPLGVVVLASHGRIKIRAGSGILLRVVPTGDATKNDGNE